MSPFEILSILSTLVVALIALASLWRTRAFSRRLLELEASNSRLADKQLTRIEESEPLEGQPVFALQTTRIIGVGDRATPEYRVNITFDVTNTGVNLLDSRGVGFVAFRDGVYKSAVVVGVHKDLRSFDNSGSQILCEHTFVVEPDSDLPSSKIHIQYTDLTGAHRTQEFGISAEGPTGGQVPVLVTYQLERVLRHVPSDQRWSI